MNQLTPKQQTNVRLFSQQVQKMSAPQCKYLLIKLYEQMQVRKAE